MKRFIIISIISCVAWAGNLKAQSADDAMLFSRHYSGGSARSAGMSGAMGAVGGDLSVLSSNPAGLAVYRSSEFTFTPGLNFTSTNTQYSGATFNDRNTHFGINNIGYAFTKNMYNEKGLQSINFGIAYNRLSDFQSDTYIKNSAATSSLLDDFVLNANKYGTGDAFYDFYEGMAYDLYAIDIDDNGDYFSDYTDYDYGQPLYRSISTRGGIGEYDFSLGFNFNHKLFLGATLGIQDVYLKEYYYHEETPGFEYMDAFNFSEEYTINGAGVNFKTGIIYRPIQMLRLGAAIHTPTALWLRPYLLTTMGVSWNTVPTPDDFSEYLETESDKSERFKITTPWRYNVSAAAVLGKFGMLDVDVEFVDYSSSGITPRADYDIENEDISAILKSSINIKAGAEIRLGPVYLRGGVACYENPYNKDAFTDAEIRKTLTNTMSYSGGIGFRKRDFYMDAAYIYMQHPKRINNLYMYDSTIEGDWYAQAALQSTASKFVLTFGFRF